MLRGEKTHICRFRPTVEELEKHEGTLKKYFRRHNGFMKFSSNSTTTVLDQKATKRKYPEARIIVLDDNFNSFEHVANCLVTVIPGMSKKRSWELAVEVDREGSAEVWRGPLEQAELYHQQLFSKGLTMAPIEKT